MVERSLSTCQEKTVFDKINLRVAVVVYWIQPNNLQSQFTIFNKFWHPVSPIDVRIDLRFLVKNSSESHYLLKDTNIFVFWKKRYDAMGTWPGNTKKGVKPFNIF